MQVSNLFGVLSIIIAIIVYGFLSVPFKIIWIKQKEKAEQLDYDNGLLIQTFMSFPILLASLIPLTFNEYKFSIYGVYGSIIWVILSCLSIIVVKQLGLSISQGIWSGTTMITSFLIGVIIFEEKFKNIYCPIIGLILLCIGIIGIGISGFELKRDDGAEKESLINDKGDDNLNKSIKSNKIWMWLFILIIVTIIVGILNAVGMIPAKLDIGNIMYIVNFGIFQFIFSNIITLLYLLFKTIIVGNIKLNRIVILNRLISGTLSGTIWSIGYCCQVFSVFSKFGMSVGLPLIQTTIIISTLNGMIIFKEVKGWFRKIIFVLCIIIILAGTFLLTYFKIV